MWSFDGDKINFAELRLFKLYGFLNLLILVAFTLWGGHFVKTTSSTVYSESFLNKA